MPRRARTYARYATYATKAALALTLAGALAACTDSSGQDSGDDTKPGGPSASATAAEPGKYRTLPEPCGTVSLNTLKDMLPGTAASEEGSAQSDPDSATPGASPSPYEGEASVTYDTDRRSGCSWKSATTLGTRHLHVDFERVVSYDPAVSDDEQAERLYDRKAAKAEIPVSPASPGDDGGAEEDGGDQTEEEQSGDGKEPEKGSSPDGGASPSGDDPSEGVSPSPGESQDSPDSDDDSSPGTEEDLGPRTLDNIGDTAYINDKLDTGDSGLHRDITLVVRAANVIATVEYDQWVTDKHRIPDSRELQDKARKLAEQLVAHFEEE